MLRMTDQSKMLSITFYLPVILPHKGEVLDVDGGGDRLALADDGPVPGQLQHRVGVGVDERGQAPAGVRLGPGLDFDGGALGDGGGGLHGDVSGVHPAVDGGGAAGGLDEVIGMPGSLGHGGDPGLTGLAGLGAGAVGAGVVLDAGKGYHGPHSGPLGVCVGLGGLRYHRGAAARHGPRIVHPGDFAVLGPGSGAVPSLFANVGHGGDLDFVGKGGGALHRQAVPDIDADMAGQPHSFTWNDRAEIG